ncbi:MAG: cysteine--tRNA ligase [Frankiaceae bacterium]|nr:cysteine--tRNA ligase [Frankiaceae bacterium]MBV9871190.1 cysteine--tRNA ligase [Frankiaceae bacterium]
MTLRLYDTRRRVIEDFAPLNPGVVTMYVCGPTVQSAPHIGHVRSAVAFDVLRRWLTVCGYDVQHIRNVTDIDDKIIVNAQAQNVPWWALATSVTRLFHEAYAALNCLPPTGEPRATGHIGEMVALIQRLFDGGHAYAAGTDVYFDVKSHPAYGELSNQQLDDVQSSEDTGDKRDPRDFALWKGTKPGEPSWETPWGPGRPGWHIECSAMVTRYFGPIFDIHGGGRDLVFPHHENELAQSCAAGDPFARFWLHHGMINIGGAKMSKSAGNSMFVPDLLAGYRPQALRYSLVAPHYRSDSDWNDDVLDEADAAYSRIEGFITRASAEYGEPATDGPVPTAFADAMNDDLGVPAGLGVLHDVVRRGNTALAGGDEAAGRQALAEVAAMTMTLGLWPGDFDGGNDSALEKVVAEVVPALLEARQAARERKDYAESDRIRDALTAAGVVVEDTPQGPRWHVGTSG